MVRQRRCYEDDDNDLLEGGVMGRGGAYKMINRLELAYGASEKCRDKDGMKKSYRNAPPPFSSKTNVVRMTTGGLWWGWGGAQNDQPLK